MAQQGKCNTCKVRFIFTDGAKVPKNVVFRVWEIACPTCDRPLSRTSKLSKLPEHWISAKRLEITLYQREDNK